MFLLMRDNDSTRVKSESVDSYLMGPNEDRICLVVCGKSIVLEYSDKIVALVDLYTLDGILGLIGILGLSKQMETYENT